MPGCCGNIRHHELLVRRQRLGSIISEISVDTERLPHALFAGIAILITACLFAASLHSAGHTSRRLGEDHTNENATNVRALHCSSIYFISGSGSGEDLDGSEGAE